MRKPFFKKSHNCWYVKDATGRMIRLDPDEKTAYKLWGRMCELERVGTTDSIQFAVLAEVWIQEHETDKDSFAQTARYIVQFSEYVGETLALDVTKAQLNQWLLEPKPGRLRKDKTRGPSKQWGQTTRRDAARAVFRVYSWAVGNAKISRNPLFGFRIPEGKPRATLVTSEQHKKMVLACRGRKNSRPLGLYLIASRCGARPRQLREVTAEQVLPDHSAWVFHEHKEDDSGRPLVVYLSPCLQTLTRILMQSRPCGPLFRNAYGEQWKKDGIVRTFQRLRKRLGITTPVTAYTYRHSFATDALLSGQSLAVVAELLGHADTRMVGKVYGHLDQHRHHLIDAVASMARKRIS